MYYWKYGKICIFGNTEKRSSYSGWILKKYLIAFNIFVFDKQLKSYISTYSNISTYSRAITLCFSEVGLNKLKKRIHNIQE